ncbi:MAG: endolytic transglycosylase MltG [Pseudomonadales bacterium]
MIRWLLSLAAVAVLVALGSVWYVQNWFVTGAAPGLGAAPRPGAATQFDVAPGSGVATVARNLHAANYIQFPRLWQLMARFEGKDKLLKAGEYELDRTLTPSQLLDSLVAGDVRLRSLVIVEGSTVLQMLQIVAQAPKLQQTLVAPDAENLLEALGLPAGHAEGRFFPDTYRYAAGESDVAILRQAHARMASSMTQAWEQRAADLPYNSPDELLIMASIVEKETGAAEDRAQISQVFARRLTIGMRLQTDPTVIYGLGSAFDGDIRSRDLVTDTPYNTYTRHGLPPTPISLPGKAALEAAAHPADGDFLYFVSRGDGTSAFSRTLPEHNAAVRRYQLKRRRQ